MRKLIVVCAASLIVLASCSDSGTDGAGDLTASPLLTSTPEMTPCVLEDTDTQAKSFEDPEAEFASVTDIRRSDGGGCARVVFEFDGNVPGYEVAYAEGPFSECGSGDAVDTSGWGAEAFLHLRVSPAGGGDPDTGEPTYKGPTDISVDGEVLKHMRRICDFEASYEWVLGVDSELDFAVKTFGDPQRLVIDIGG